VVPASDKDSRKAEEITELVREIRERVRARYPDSSAANGSIAVPDLMPLVHARDAAEAKVAAIGSVNPRPGGPLNSVIQWVKRNIARGLDWFIRDQVVFNRQAIACVEATIEALNEVNRTLIKLSLPIGELRGEAAELKDVRSHWTAWRAEWEQKLFINETQFLRSLADLQIAFQHRATLMETNFRDIVKSQHADYLGALDRSTLDIQKRLWADLEKIRLEYDRLIHSELRVVRQHVAARSLESATEAIPAQPTPSQQPRPGMDYLRFAERFRGSEEYVRNSFKFYVPLFSGRKDVLDIGCGRGEFLALMHEAGVPARGIDLSSEWVALCVQKGLRAEVADLFRYLGDLTDFSLDSIFCAQVVEHLPPDRIPEFIRLAAQKLVRDGLIVIETPNPECLAIFATHFYLDPSHTRPVPHPLLAFYMEEHGLGGIELHRRSPAVDSIPELAEVPQGVRDALFGGLDYAIIGRKLT
jgi:2-polyprenyl-3-methyl-5-hydroxy-6-metoxy-1,4-benzoquinol methylase